MISTNHEKNWNFSQLWNPYTPYSFSSLRIVIALLTPKAIVVARMAIDGRTKTIQRASKKTSTENYGQ